MATRPYTPRTGNSAANQRYQHSITFNPADANAEALNVPMEESP